MVSLCQILLGGVMAGRGVVTEGFVESSTGLIDFSSEVQRILGFQWWQDQTLTIIQQLLILIHLSE